jgi:hypothetical protein
LELAAPVVPISFVSGDQVASGGGVSAVDLELPVEIVDRLLGIEVNFAVDDDLAVTPIEAECGHPSGNRIDVLGHLRKVSIAAGHAVIILVLGDHNHVIARRAAARWVEPGGSLVSGGLWGAVTPRFADFALRAFSVP